MNNATQGSEAWHKERLGNLTGSRIIDIMPGKSGYRASRKNYVAECVCARLTGIVPESFTSVAMQWGTDTEPLARSAYEAITGNLVEEVGYIQSDIEHFGGSPDGLIGDDGITEIKCPNTATHFEVLLGGKIKLDYLYQMQGYLMIAKRKWCDFVSFDPRLPDKHSLYIKRFEYNDEMAEKMLNEVNSFLAEVDEMMEKLG